MTVIPTVCTLSNYQNGTWEVESCQ